MKINHHGMENAAHGVVDYGHNHTQRLGDELLRMNQYVSNPFDSMLDHLLHIMHIEPLVKVNDKMLDFASKILSTWGEVMAKSTPEHMMWFDIMGSMYEYCASHMGKKHMGQFFTPAHICDFMSAIIAPHDYGATSKLITISDPTCGSGRMLLSAANHIYNNLPEDGYRYMDGYFMCANDLDYKCTKMTIINYFLHGITGEVTCANGLFIDDDYRFGYQIKCIPIWKYYCGLASKLIKELQEGISYLELDQFLSMFDGDKDAAIKHLALDREVAKTGRHYDKYMHPEVKKKIQYYILYSDIDGTTYHSVPGGDSIFLIKKITKDESYQVAIERNMFVSQEKKIKEEHMNKTGVGLFADVKINADVIKVKKAKVTKATKTATKVTKKKSNINKSSFGEQISLF